MNAKEEKDQRQREHEAYQRGYRHGRRDLIADLKALLNLDVCSHCEHENQ